MDKDTSLETTDKVLKTSAEAANNDTKVNIDAAAVLAETNKAVNATEVIQAKSDAAIKKLALQISGFLVIMIMSFQIWFAYIGKTFAVPDIIWVFVVFPWLGAGSSKLAEYILRSKK